MMTASGAIDEKEVSIALSQTRYNTGIGPKLLQVEVMSRYRQLKVPV